MNRTSFIKPVSELGSGFINYTTGPHTLVDSIVPAVSGGTIDVGSDAYKFGNVWANSGYFGGEEAKLVVGHHVDVNGPSDDDALCVRQSGFNTDAIQVEYSNSTTSEDRNTCATVRAYAFPYVEPVEGEEQITYNIYGATTFRADVQNRGFGFVINNIHDSNPNIASADDRKGILINGTQGHSSARGLQILHNNTHGAAGFDIQMSDVGLLSNAGGGAGARIQRNGTIGSAKLLDLADNTIFGSTEVMADIQSKSPSTCLRIQQTANGKALHVASSGTNVVALIEKPTGTGGGLRIENDGTGKGIEVNQDGDNLALHITQNGQSTGATLTQTQDFYAFNVQQQGDQVGINIDKTGTGTGHAIRVDNDGTGYGVFVNQVGATNAMRVVQNANADGTYIRKVATGAGSTLVVDDEGAGTALYILSNGSGGNGIFCSHSTSSVLGNFVAANESFATSMLYNACHRAANSAYSFLVGVSDSNGTPDTEVKLRGDGVIQSDQAATTPADYAEYFECLDPAGIEPGFAVQLCSDQDNASKVKVATDANEVLGFVSAAPAVIGDSAWSRWTGKYLKTEFGAYQLDKNGDRVLNPEFDPDQDYVPRGERPEWKAVGLLGKLWVRSQDTDIVPGDKVTLGNDGMVRRATKEDAVKWPVIEVREYLDDSAHQTIRVMYK